jgi:hypothetical protein
MPLVPAPYSKKNLVDAGDRYFNLQPYKGGWIVTVNGVHMGTVKKLKSGWVMDRYAGPSARPHFERAIRLLDEHFGVARDPVRRLTARQSQKRVRALHRAGVPTTRVRLPNGDVVVLRPKRDPMRKHLTRSKKRRTTRRNPMQPTHGHYVSESLHWRTYKAPGLRAKGRRQTYVIAHEAKNDRGRFPWVLFVKGRRHGAYKAVWEARYAAERFELEPRAAGTAEPRAGSVRGRTYT